MAIPGANYIEDKKRESWAERNGRSSRVGHSPGGEDGVDVLEHRCAPMACVTMTACMCIHFWKFCIVSPYFVIHVSVGSCMVCLCPCMSVQVCGWYRCVH